jgi:putative colanic acid biosynthesis acetyltransferase WcaF
MSSEVAPALTDLPSNRAARKYSRSEQLRRVLWTFGEYALRLSPRPCFAWRRSVLRLFGAKVGRSVNVYSSTRFYMPWNVEIGDWAAVGEHAFIYSLGKVYIGAGASVAYRAHICAGTHDFSDPALPLLKPTVIIEDQAWIGTDAFIGPGVTVCRGAIVGARAVVVKDVPAMQIVGGNPARRIGVRRLPSGVGVS